MQVYISPSSQFNNKYSCGNFSEAETCYQIGIACRDYLAQFVDTKMPDKPDTTYQERVQESNDWGADIHLCIHTNAGGGDGTVVFCHPKNTGNTVINTVYDMVSDLSPGDDDGIRPVTTLYEINKTNALCVYVECEFHDHPVFSRWILDNVVRIGQTIAKGILIGSGVVFNPNDVPDEIRPESAYKVICGSFSVPKNARARVKELISKGISAFMREADKNGMYRVQVGAFSSLDNAKALKQKLSDIGYECFITQD